MKHKPNRKRLAVQVTATALAAVMLAAPAQTIAYAADLPQSGIALLTGEQEAQTVQKTLYTVGNVSYENGSNINKGNGQDVQQLGVWVPKDGTFRIRQVDTSLGQTLQLRMWANDSQVEFYANIPANGDWLTVTAKADCVPFIYSIHRADGKQPVVEYEVDGQHELPVYHIGDDEQAFFQRWDELGAPFAVYESDEYATFLIPERDKTSNRFGSLDDLLTYYDNMVRQYNAFSGLSKEPGTEVWNQDSGTRFFIKADANGVGAAYYHPHKTAVNSPSIAGYLMYGWGALHEVGHGYNTVGFNSAEIWNNVLSHYYQVATLGKGQWLNLTEDARKRYDEQMRTLGYTQTNQYDAKLYMWVNMLDKLGPQKTSAYAYQLYRGNKAQGIANLSGFDFYADAYTRGSGYNVSKWFELWGISISDSVEQALAEAELYRNVYPLQNLVSTTEKAEAIREALGLTSRYSLVETRELVQYSRQQEAVTGTLRITLDDGAYEAVKGQKLRVTDGVDTVEEVEITAAELTVTLPAGLYTVLMPSPAGTEPIILNNRVGYATVAEGETVQYEVTAENLAGADSFADYTLTLGTTYGDTYNYCVAATDMANGTLRIVSTNQSPHVGYGKNQYSSITVYDETGAEVYKKIHTGSGNTAEDKTIEIKPGYRIELTHQEPWRGIRAYSSAASSVKLLENNVAKGAVAAFEVTERGLKEITPTVIEAQDSYYNVLCAYMDALKTNNVKPDFQNSAKLPAEKARVNVGFANLTAEQQEAFRTAYKGYYPFNQGVQTFTIAPIGEQDYTGSAVTPALTVTADGQSLTEADYRLEWLRNVDVGTAKVKVFGLNDYENYIGEASFEIRLAPDTAFTVECEYDSVEFSGGAKRPYATVKVGDRVLTLGTDYTLSHENNTNVGTASVVATGIGNYSGIVGRDTFTITGKIVALNVSVSPAKVNYTGSPVDTGVTVMVGKQTLTAGTDYTFSFENNTEIGAATVKVTGMGNYTGSTGSTTFEITQPLNPDPIGGSAFSNWTYALYNFAYTPTIFSQMNFDMEAGTLTVSNRPVQPHYNFKGTSYASVTVYDSDGSRSYTKSYIGDQTDQSPADTVKLGVGYIVEIYVAEPTRGATSVSANAATSISMRPLKTARYLVTERGLKEITADGSTSATDMASQYDKVLRAYMDQLKKDNPTQEDFCDAEKFPDKKAIVEKGVALLTADELASFKADYAGYYPFAAPATYTVEYDWGTDFPSDVQLPVNDQTYQSEEAALAAMETTFTSSSTSTAKKGDLTGTWTFSGWTANVEGAVVKFNGTWTFTADVPLVDAEAPAAITLTDTECEEGQTVALDGSTTVTDNGTITYQWYSANAADDFNGTPITGEVNATFTPNTDVAGTYYYYVIATNTRDDATGQKTASTRSNMATVTVTAPAVPVTYTVEYDWGSEFPADATLPRNGNTYQHIQDAKESVDTTYTAQSTSVSQKDGKDGTWTFSGWTASVEGTVVKFTGSWSFTEAALVDAAAPALINLTGASYEVGDTIAALNGATTVSDDGVLTYQWYVSDAADNFNGTPIDGETDESYTPAIAATGTYYYYVVATNTKADATGSQTGSTTSNMAVITVREKDAAPPIYAIRADAAEHGKVTLSTRYAARGRTVTVTVTPDEGFRLSSLTVTDRNGNALTLTDKGDGKYSFTMPAGRVSVSAVFEKESSPVSFRDVKETDFFYPAVQWAVEQGITTGTSADTFSPNAGCTRAETVTFLWRAAGSPEPESAANPFTDLSTSAYYYKAVLWAIEQGITVGTSAETFSPDLTVTRAQTVTFLARAAKAAETGSSRFDDVADDAYYANAVLWAERNSVTTGTGGGKFSPHADCTRAQIVTFLWRAHGGQ